WSSDVCSSDLNCSLDTLSKFSGFCQSVNFQYFSSISLIIFLLDASKRYLSRFFLQKIENSFSKSFFLSFISFSKSSINTHNNLCFIRNVIQDVFALYFNL